ncbi:hypothetical protein [Hymenobacter weizhouensis]|uniref:hypothetical protein n=1 Tax=Hymenobacter sp. YIM 151500-1 TaxID=2987689 RepID=UPI00222750D7|nr:hypothetical protein [Hymenobacter sp. YIM 151500-1]UYZ62578.1 hypothetical protein OIS53_16450 [Hymenobacter sp. YIM 151500-1]
MLLGLLSVGPAALAQQRTAPAASANDEPPYRKEFVYGVNFNTRGGLIGGASVRSTRVLSQEWARFWGIEAVEVKHPKEQKIISPFTGGGYVPGKANYLFVLRPSVGVQRVIFRKAAESGVQVNALVGAGPSIGLLMPYYITYDYTQRDGQGRPVPGAAIDIRNEQYDPDKHGQTQLVIDRAPLFTGVSETRVNVGAHLRAALSFEYGRYRDAVAGIETGALVEAYPKRLTILRSSLVTDDSLNDLFFPSVYLTLYLGQRN